MLRLIIVRDIPPSSLIYVNGGWIKHRLWDSKRCQRKTGIPLGLFPNHISSQGSCQPCEWPTRSIDCFLLYRCWHVDPSWSLDIGSFVSRHISSNTLSLPIAIVVMRWKPCNMESCFSTNQPNIRPSVVFQRWRSRHPSVSPLFLCHAQTCNRIWNANVIPPFPDYL